MYKKICVAPHAGAWIETPLSKKCKNILMSHPMRVRGLKLEIRARDSISN